MKIGIPLVLAALGLFAVPVRAGRDEKDSEVGKKIPQFTASAVSTVDSSASKMVTAYVLVGVKCGATPRYEKRIQALESEFRPKGVDFVYLFPNKTETKEEKLAWMKKLGLRGPMIDDEGAKISKVMLACKQTAQVILTDKDGKIVFRGGFDDNADESKVEHRYFADALGEVLAGKPVTVTTARVFG